MVLLLRFIRVLGAGLGIAMLVTLGLIALNFARFGDQALTRFRGPSYLLWAAVAVFVFARPNPLSAARDCTDHIRRLFSHPKTFSVIAGTGLVFYLLASTTQHLSFNTFSHDLSIFDESLYNTLHGNFLHSSILGRSFFSEHFSPTLLLLLPLYLLGANTTTLVAAHAVVLWAAVLVLRRVAKSSTLPPEVQNLLCLVYLCHPISVHTLNYAFHIEALLPLLVFSVWLSFRRHRWALFWVSLILLLGIKEDVGIYVAGLGLYLVVGRRRPLLGTAVGVVGLAWTWVAVSVVIPAFGGPEIGYAFLSRWGQWGDSFIGVVLGFVTHPLAFASALVNTRILKYLACLLFLPFVGRWKWLLIAGPWVVNATSGLEIQSQLGLYYGIPFLVFGVIASIEVLQQSFVSVSPSRRWAPVLVTVAIVLNFANFTFPEVPRCRWAVIRAVQSIPTAARIGVMPCLYPIVERSADKTLLLRESDSDSDFEVLRTGSTTWPFTPKGMKHHIQRRIESGDWRITYEIADFVILERKE